MSLTYQLLNKPWEWRQVREAYRARREAEREFIEFWTRMSLTTCRACLHEKPSAHFDDSRICGKCWQLLALPVDKLTVRQSIRVNRMDEYFIARGIGSIRNPAWSTC